MTQRITCRLPRWMVQALDCLVEEGQFLNRGEAVRAALREKGVR